MTTTDWLRLCTEYVIARIGIRPRDDRGLTAAEIAVITVLLVGSAIVVVGFIANAAKNNANNIPDPQAP